MSREAHHHPLRRAAALTEVLAIGHLVGIVEWACMRAVAGDLDDGEAILGVHVDLSHDAPTPPGVPVIVEVDLARVEGRQLTFSVHAHDDAATICGGAHRRAVINTSRSGARLAERVAARSARSGSRPW